MIARMISSVDRDVKTGEGARTGKRRGRPPAQQLDDRILTACFAVLSEVGYARMSVEEVARRAAVTRPTVYRRWPSKEVLAVAALQRAQAVGTDEPLTGDLEADLAARLQRLRRTLMRPQGMAIIGTMLAEEHLTPKLIDEFRQLVIADRRESFRHAFPTGTVSAADRELLIDLAVGAFYARYIAGAAFPPDWAAQVAKMITHAYHAQSPR